MNVLVVAPHPDDEAIGCGGSIIRHADAGDRVHVVFLTSGEKALEHVSRDEAWRVREGEARAAGEVLGVAELSFWRLPDFALGDDVEGLTARLRETLDAGAFERVYAPHPDEWHPDHRAASAATAAAAAAVALTTWWVYGYEVWTPLREAEMVEDVSAVMDRKLRAVECYPSQLSPIDYRRGVEGLNAYRGALVARTAYAEAFARIDGRED